MIYKGPERSTYWGSDKYKDRRAEVMHDEERTETKKVVLKHKGIELAYLEINNKKEKVSGSKIQ